MGHDIVQRFGKGAETGEPLEVALGREDGVGLARLDPLQQGRCADPLCGQALAGLGTRPRVVSRVARMRRGSGFFVNRDVMRHRAPVTPTAISSSSNAPFS